MVLRHVGPDDVMTGYHVQLSGSGEYPIGRIGRLIQGEAEMRAKRGPIAFQDNQWKTIEIRAINNEFATSMDRATARLVHRLRCQTYGREKLRHVRAVGADSDQGCFDPGVFDAAGYDQGQKVVNMMRPADVVDNPAPRFEQLAQSLSGVRFHPSAARIAASFVRLCTRRTAGSRISIIIEWSECGRKTLSPT